MSECMRSQNAEAEYSFRERCEVNDRKWRKHLEVSVCTQILTEFDTSQTNAALEFSDILLLDSLFGCAVLFIAQSP